MTGKTIGVITSSFPRFTGDFAGGFVHHMTRAMMDLGYTMEVVVPEPAGPTEWRNRSRWPSNMHIHSAPYARAGSRHDRSLALQPHLFLLVYRPVNPVIR